MRYLNVYYDYLKELDRRKNELGEYLAAKENDNSYAIIHLKEKKAKIYLWLIVADALLMIFSSFVYAMIKEYFEVKDMIYYLLFAILVNIAIISVIFIFNNKIKQLQLEDNSDETIKFKQEYRMYCDKIYQICPFIIILNEYYYELKELNEEKRREFYKTKVLEVQKNVNFISKGYINSQAYKDYLENWIIKNKE